MTIIIIGIVAALLYCLQQVIYAKNWGKNLKVSLKFCNDHIIEGERSSLAEIIENRKALPLTMLKVKFSCSRELVFYDMEGSSVTDLYYRNDVFVVMPYQKITRTLDFCGKKRGYYNILGIDLVASDLFLQKENVRYDETDTWFYIYPKPYTKQEFVQVLMQLNGEVIAKRHMIEDPFEYRGIREYQTYDDVKSINWKATAKTGDFMVNEKNFTSVNNVRIFINLEDRGVLRKEDMVEISIQMAAGLVENFLDLGMQVSLFCNSKDLITKEPLAIAENAGSGQANVINRGLARLDTGNDALPFAQLFRDKVMEEKKSNITLFLSPNGYEDFQELLLDYQETGKEYYWIYPVKNWDKTEISETLESRIKRINMGA